MPGPAPGAAWDLSRFLALADADQKLEPTVGLSETATWAGNVKEYLGSKIAWGKNPT